MLEVAWSRGRARSVCRASRRLISHRRHHPSPSRDRAAIRIRDPIRHAAGMTMTLPPSSCFHAPIAPQYASVCLETRERNARLRPAVSQETRRSADTRVSSRLDSRALPLAFTRHASVVSSVVVSVVVRIKVITVYVIWIFRVKNKLFTISFIRGSAFGHRQAWRAAHGS